LLVISHPLFALQSDAAQTARFASDNVSFNDNNGTTIYSGNVKMEQGTTHLIADKVVVYRNKDGSTDKAVATGKLAHYITLPDNQKDPVDAFGDKIEYYPQKHLAIIIGNGNVIQSKNSLKGPYIIYDMVKQTVTSVAPPSTPAAEKKSLIILQPWDLPGEKSEPQVQNREQK
jgi:lipopolysaccharide export system protein LptA